MKEQTQEITFDHLDLKTKVWAVLSVAVEDMPLRTLLAILGFNKEKVGPDKLNLEQIEHTTLEAIKGHMKEYMALFPEEKAQFQKQYGTLGDIQIIEYYSGLMGKSQFFK